MNTVKTIPKFLKSLLWSYKLNALDLEKDKDIIITQVLNYGSWEEIKWLYSVYAESEIKTVVNHPKKGLWFEKVLNFWEKMFDIRIPKKIYRNSILTVKPRFK